MMMMMNSINLVEPNSVCNGYAGASTVRSKNFVSQRRKSHKSQIQRKLGNALPQQKKMKLYSFGPHPTPNIPYLPVPFIPSIVPLPCPHALAPSTAPFSISDDSLLFSLYCPWHLGCQRVQWSLVNTHRLRHLFHSRRASWFLVRLGIRFEFSPSDGPSRDASTESEAQQGTETPASSLDFDIANIGPRLMELGPIKVTETSTCPPSTEVSASSAGYPVSSTDLNLTEISTRRVTRGAANAANLEPGSRLPSPHVTRSSRKRGRPRKAAWWGAKGERAPRQNESVYYQTYSSSAQAITSPVIYGVEIFFISFLYTWI